MTATRIEEMLSDSGFGADELAGLVVALAPLELLVDEAPTPSAELAALFVGAEPTPVSPSVRRKRAVAGALVLAISGVGATGLSAAANTLPRSLQHRVHEFSTHYLPFDLPEPPPPGQPLGVDVLPAPYEDSRPGDTEASRSAQQRPGIPAYRANDAGPGSQVHTDTYAVGPSAAPSQSAYAQPSPTSSPSAAPSPSGSPSGGHGDTGGRPTKASTKGPGKDDTKHGTDTSGATGGQGSDPDAQQGSAPLPSPDGGDPMPTPTVPDPSAPTIPLPTLPAPLPDPGPVLQSPDPVPQTDGN